MKKFLVLLTLFFVSLNCSAQLRGGIEIGSHDKIEAVSAQIFWDSPKKAFGARFRCDKNDGALERCDISAGPNFTLGKAKVSSKFGATTDKQWMIMPSVFKKTHSGFGIFAVANAKFGSSNPDTIFLKSYIGKNAWHLRVSHFSVNEKTVHIRVGPEFRKDGLYFAPYWDAEKEYFGAYAGYRF